MIRSRAFAAPLLMAIGLAVPQLAHAQAYIGPHIAWGDEFDVAIGARAGISLSRLLSPDPGQGTLTRFEAILAFDWFLSCDECSYFEVTPAVTAPIRLGESFTAYLGAGLNIARFSRESGAEDVGGSGTDLGLALLGGAEFPIAAFTSFIELRAGIAGADQVVISFGFLFGPG